MVKSRLLLNKFQYWWFMSTSYQHVFLTSHLKPPPLLFFWWLKHALKKSDVFFLSRSPQLSLSLLLRSPVKFSRDRNWWSCCISWCSKAAPSSGPLEAPVGTTEMAPCHGVGMMGWARLGISSWCILMSTFKWHEKSWRWSDGQDVCFFLMMYGWKPWLPRWFSGEPRGSIWFADPKMVHSDYGVMTRDVDPLNFN